ncbi:MAG: hypothetical protein R3F46_16510 [bacterium]
MGAVAVFINVQLWMHDPRRREFNAEWYRQFESFRRSRYDSREMLESVEGFSEHFHRDPHIAG